MRLGRTVRSMSDRAAGRRRWPVWVGIALAAVLVLCGGPGVLVLTVVALPGIPVSIAGPAVWAEPKAVRSPRPGDPEPVRRGWLREQMQQQLDRQAAALLRGDERTFLAVADPAAPAARDLKRLFRTLRAMRVTAWRPAVPDEPVRTGEFWRAAVTYEHCFVVPACRTSPVVLGTRWADGATGPRLVAVEASLAQQDGPRPWEINDLRVAVGARTLVATTPAYRSRLPELLRQAERAAAVADRYAVGRPPPDRYRIFYAGRTEWTRWYGGGRPDWTAGYAVGIGGDRYDVVLNSTGLHANLLDDLLRHELTHASSLPGRGSAGDANWWLVEGIAEYAAASGHPLGRYDHLPDLRRLVQGGWDGRLDTVKPPSDATDWEVSGRYAIGYLAVRHLIDRFGEQRVLDFIEAVLHRGEPVPAAAQRFFGIDWIQLDEDCVSYVRSVAA